MTENIVWDKLHMLISAKLNVTFSNHNLSFLLLSKMGYKTDFLHLEKLPQSIIYVSPLNGIGLNSSWSYELSVFATHQ